MGWRNQGQTPSGGSGSPGGGGNNRSWRQPTLGRVTPESRPATASQKARRLQVLGSTFAATCAILFYLGTLLIGCTQTEMIVTTAFVYETKQAKRSPIPPNWMGDSDQQALLQLNATKLKVTSSQEELDFERRLKNFPKRSVCVVYVSAHAALEPFAVDPSVDRVETKDADVVLLSTKDDLDAVSTRVHLNDLWNALQRLPKDQKKLVLLDVSRLQGQWRLGVYDNFAVAGIQEAVDRYKIPNLFVMTSCAAGESSWVSPDLGSAAGQSVFGYFVAQGLAGEADKRPDGKLRDHRVSVRELFEYVNRKVNDWVQRNRDSAGQHPQLFPSVKDSEGADTTFVVCAVSKRQPSTKAADDGAAAGDFQDAQSKLFKVWERRAKLDQAAMTPNAIYHLEPIRWRALAHLLMRAEEFLIHHRAERAEQAIEEANSLCLELEDRYQRGRFAELASETKFLAPLARRFGLGAATENDTAEADDSQTPLPDDQLQRVLQTAHQQHTMPLTLNPTDVDKCRRDLVNLRRSAEQVAFGHHTVLRWLQVDLAVADRARREAEDGYFVLDGAEVLQRAAKAGEQFQVLDQRARDLEETQFVLHRASAILPEWLMFVSERWTEDRRGRGEIMNRYHEPILKDHQPRAEILETVWTTTKDARWTTTKDARPSSVLDAAEAEILYTSLLAIALRDLLPERFGPVSKELLSQLTAKTTELQDRLQSIERKLQTEAERLRNTSQTQWIDWRLKRDLLRCPNLKPDTRRELLKKLIRESAELAADKVEAKPSADAPQVDADMALWQMLCTVHALSLGPAPPGLANDTLWDQWHKSRRGETRGNRDTLIQLGREIRRQWARHLSEVLNDCGASLSRDATRACWDRKDQSSRVLHPNDAIALQSNEQTPPRRFDQFLLAESLLDTAGRYTEDFWNGWYDVAAQACLDKATFSDCRALDDDCQKAITFLKSRGAAQLVLDCAPIEFGTRAKVIGSVRIKRDTQLPRGLATSWLGTPEDDRRSVKNDDRRSVKNLADNCTPKSFGLSVGDETATPSKYSLSIDRPAIPPNCQMSYVVPRLFFRGHTFRTQQQLVYFNPCKPNGVVWHYLNSYGTGAIQVDGVDRLPIVFVLDCSSSMLVKSDPPNPAKDVDRWAPAQRALLTVLKDVEKFYTDKKVPPIEFQLIVFGQGNAKKNPNFVAIERPMGLLTERAIDEVKITLNRLKPEGYTPLLESIQLACDSLRKSGAVIVITDGEATDGVDLAKIAAAGQGGADTKTQQALIKADPEVVARRTGEIEASLKASRSQLRPIELHVIGLGFNGVVGSELKAFVEKGNIGTFYEEGKQQSLENLLRATTSQRKFFVRKDGDGDDQLKEGSLGKQIPKLLPGLYRVAFADRDRLQDFPTVELRGGELFKFQLKSDGGLEQTPETFKGSAPLKKTFKESPYEFGWDNFQPVPKEKEYVEFVVGVRRVDNPDSGALFTPRPQRIVVDINPTGRTLSDPLPLTWDIEPNKTRPTWSIKIKDWPSSSVELSAYVSWELTKPDKTLELKDVKNVPAKVELPLSKTERANFEVSIVLPGAGEATDAEGLGNDFVEVHLKLNDSDGASVVEREWRHLAYMDVRLLQRDLPVQPIAVSQEMLLKKDREVIWRFSQLPKGFQPDEVSIAITSWDSFKREAFKIEKPLVIPRRDDQ